jgi:hypothetical protein
LRFNFVVAAHLVSALHSSVFARLASGAFYETIVLATSYEIISFDGFAKSPRPGHGEQSETRSFV